MLQEMFCLPEGMLEGVLEGCRPYLAVDSTPLTGKFGGQLATAAAVDANNWTLPVAYGIIEEESDESWTWFMERLRGVIGHPPGLVIRNNACNGLENVVDVVFTGVEHRECMRRLSVKFMKKFKGKIFENNL